jgi:hypothetical protein
MCIFRTRADIAKGNRKPKDDDEGLAAAADSPLGLKQDWVC